ncbi:MAG: radical SAM protein [Firmicutes bacterium]|nr:radical SAM protein [Bacillota bacterium]
MMEAPRIRQFELKKWNGRPIVLCGVLAKVAPAVDFLWENGVRDSVFICDDERAGGSYRQAQIIGAESLPRQRGNNFLLGGKVFYARYRRFLPEMTLNSWFYMSLLLQDPYERKGYENLMGRFFRRRSEVFIMPGIDVVVSQRCNLRCRYCAHRMQFYTSPREYDEQDYLKSFGNILRAGVGVTSVRVIGGEPFLFPERINRFIECFGESDQIFCIDIPTNGTLLLPEKTLAALAGCPKATVLISDYGVAKSRAGELTAQLREYHVAHLLYPADSPWYDVGDLIRYERTLEETQELYRRCRIKESCAALLGHELYLCPVAAHGAALGAVPKPTDEYVDLRDTVHLRERLIRFQTRRTHLTACRYCLGGRTPAPRGLQSPKALPYRIFEES